MVWCSVAGHTIACLRKPSCILFIAVPSYSLIVLNLTSLPKLFRGCLSFMRAKEVDERWPEPGGRAEESLVEEKAREWRLSTFAISLTPLRKGEACSRQSSFGVVIVSCLVIWKGQGGKCMNGHKCFVSIITTIFLFLLKVIISEADGSSWGSTPVGDI